MSQLNREGLISQSNYLFPDNTTAEITPADVRQFNTDLADSLALTGSNVVSASHAEVADLATVATNSTYSDNTIVYGKNVHTLEIPKGTPLYFTGSGTQGNLVGILPADAGNPLLMPAGGVAGETIAVGEEGVVLLDGFINGVNTSLFQSGQTVYVGVGGGYTNQKPTGSANLIQALGYVEKAAVNGSGVIKGSGRANDVPNIQEGYLWVGNSDGVAQTVATSSIATQVDTGSLATTGSNTFNGDQIISGSVNLKGQYPVTGVGTTSSLVSIDSDSGTIKLYGNQSFGIPFSPLELIGGGGPDGFTPAVIRGVDVYGGNKISGSWGAVGNGPGGAGTSGVVGIYNNATSSEAGVVIRHRANTGGELSYAAYESFPAPSGGESQLRLRGTTINLQASTGSKQTSVTVDGDVTGSTFTGSFVGDGTGLTLHSNVAYTNASNTFTQPQIINGDTTINGDTEITASSSTSQAFKVWDGSYTDGGQPAPVLRINSADDRASGSREAVTIQGGALFAPALNAEPSDADTYPMFITDAQEPRIIVFSQNDAAQGGQNIVLNGSVSIGGVDKNVVIEANAQNAGGDIDIVGNNVTIQSQNPMTLNSAVTLNGATLINAGIYQSATTVSNPANPFNTTLNNQRDYFVFELQNNQQVILNTNSLIGPNGRTTKLHILQNAQTGSVELFQGTGNPYQIYGPSGSFSGSFLSTTTTPGGSDYFELVNMQDRIIITKWLPDLVDGTF